MKRECCTTAQYLAQRHVSLCRQWAVTVMCHGRKRAEKDMRALQPYLTYLWVSDCYVVAKGVG